jgi:hypothetical protein
MLDFVSKALVFVECGVDGDWKGWLDSNQVLGVRYKALQLQLSGETPEALDTMEAWARSAKISVECFSCLVDAVVTDVVVGPEPGHRSLVLDMDALTGGVGIVHELHAAVCVALGLGPFPLRPPGTTMSLIVRGCDLVAYVQAGPWHHPGGGMVMVPVLAGLKTEQVEMHWVVVDMPPHTVYVKDAAGADTVTKLQIGPHIYTAGRMLGHTTRAMDYEETLWGVLATTSPKTGNVVSPVVIDRHLAQTDTKDMTDTMCTVPLRIYRCKHPVPSPVYVCYHITRPIHVDV